MFKNYIMTAFRNIIRDKLFSSINIFGLAIGFAACLLIFLFVWSETNYDTWIKDSDRIYRVESTYHLAGRGALPNYTVPGPVKNGLINDYAVDVEAATRVMGGQQTIRRDAQIFPENVTQVDSEFFDIFNLNFTSGSSANALPDTKSTAISHKLARKYFGDQNPMGEVITIISPRGTNDYRITAIFEDIPDESHLTGDVLILIDENALEQVTTGILTSWFFPSTFTYVKLREGVTPESINAKLIEYADRNNTVPPVPSYAGKKGSEYLEMMLQNVRDIHLDDRATFDMKPHGSIFTVYAFSAIAALLLIIASINFINLSTARALRRSKEVALRKTMGAERSQLVTQFLMEAILTVIAAAAIALLIVNFTLPFYNEMLNLTLTLDQVLTPLGIISFIGFSLGAALLSGAYPAFFVSRARPGDVLHSNKSGSDGSTLLRTSLVTLQFAISIALISATTILFQQTSYVSGLDLGFEKENIGVLRVPFSQQVHENAKGLQDDIRRIPGVQSVGLSNNVPVDQGFASFAVFSPAIDSTDSTSMSFVAAGYDYFETYGIKPLAGRLFSEKYGTDIIDVRFGQASENEGTIILNKSALVRVGFETADEALGQVLTVNQPDGSKNTLTIVGVIPDVHYGDARLPTQPMIFYYLSGMISSVSFKFDPSQLDSIRSEIEKVWSLRLPDNPINMQFIEDMMGAQYDADRRQGNLLAAFSLLTVLVAGLGLYGLASFMAARRTKEVGLRKVMGASVSDIVSLFVLNMSKPILVANIIAWPVAWYLMNDWLATFTYRIDMGITPFLIAGIVVSLFGALTVAGRTFKVAKTHPSIALRHE